MVRPLLLPVPLAVGWQLWQLDMTSQSSVDALMKRMKDTYGRIDFLFLNAGER
jgi:NADP-dependent 3-hydroxy acid dehydrogenase YdfG